VTLRGERVKNTGNIMIGLVVLTAASLARGLDLSDRQRHDVALVFSPPGGTKGQCLEQSGLNVILGRTGEHIPDLARGVGYYSP
jgi:hypothetical protein